MERLVCSGRSINMSNKWRNPLPEEIETPEFEAVWNCIKKWDIATGLDKDNNGNNLYCGATGNHVVAILDSLLDSFLPSLKFINKKDKNNASKLIT